MPPRTYPGAILGNPGFRESGVTGGLWAVFHIVSVPDRLKAQGNVGRGEGGRVAAGDDLERDMLDTLQASSDGAAEFEARRVGDCDEDVQRALQRHRG